MLLEKCQSIDTRFGSITDRYGSKCGSFSDSTYRDYKSGIIFDNEMYIQSGYLQLSSVCYCQLDL